MLKTWKITNSAFKTQTQEILTFLVFLFYGFCNATLRHFHVTHFGYFLLICLKSDTIKKCMTGTSQFFVIPENREDKQYKLSPCCFWCKQAPGNVSQKNTQSWTTSKHKKERSLRTKVKNPFPEGNAFQTRPPVRKSLRVLFWFIRMAGVHPRTSYPQSRGALTWHFRLYWSDASLTR